VPDHILRNFDLKDTSATMVRLVVKTNHSAPTIK
jgi:hypothetical protein